MLVDKCMLRSQHQNAEQNYNIQIAKRSFENVAKIFDIWE
jgi:hypothetical protein